MHFFSADLVNPVLTTEVVALAFGVDATEQFEGQGNADLLLGLEAACEMCGDIGTGLGLLGNFFNIGDFSEFAVHSCGVPGGFPGCDDPNIFSDFISAVFNNECCRFLTPPGPPPRDLT
jgi:hypothetical protein